jgi:hypothetical protein
MGIYRTYFDKNTTIISNSTLNTARNPILQLFYGNNSNGVMEYSRYLFHFDMVNIINKINDKTILGNTTHALKFKNTSFFDGELIAADFDAKKRAYSFDLILFKIPEFWDEGAGYDVVPQIFESPNNNAYISGPANWYKRTTIDDWTYEGIFDYSGASPTIITTQHFELGNEDIEIDITDEVNSIITGATNYGYCISFARPYETLSGSSQQQYVGFYAKDTNTYYEPFVETIWNDLIENDRDYFFMGKTNRLIYNAYVNGNFVNLDSLPIVQILDENGVLISGGTSGQITKGVYYFDIKIDENSNLDRFQYSDSWNLTYNGINKTVTGKFTLLSNDYFLPSP